MCNPKIMAIISEIMKKLIFFIDKAFFDSPIKIKSKRNKQLEVTFAQKKPKLIFTLSNSSFNTRLIMFIPNTKHIIWWYLLKFHFLSIFFFKFIKIPRCWQISYRTGKFILKIFLFLFIVIFMLQQWKH